MKHLRLSLFVLGLLLVSTASFGLAQGTGGTLADLNTGFTYQGRLTDGSALANGAYDFIFALYDDPTGGSQIGGTLTLDDVSVNDGLFTVILDFGNVFDGTALYLEIAVRPGSDSGAYTALAPRQALTAAPYASYALSAPWSGLSGVPAGFADGVDDDTTYTAGMGLTLSGNQFSLNTTYTDGRYWRLGGNTLSAEGSLGSANNYALNFVVNNQRALRLEPNATSPNVIGGHSGNTVTSGVIGATIGGGGTGTSPNRVTDDYGVVGGGLLNRAGDNAGTTTDRMYATVGGGHGNTASGDYATVSGGWGNTASGSEAAVGGGYYNIASHSGAFVGAGAINNASGIRTVVGGGAANAASGEYSFIGGGWQNTASGDYATIGGGQYNIASGQFATVPGGEYNTAQGNYSFAAGRRAKARNQGCFVWSDATDLSLSCTTDNRAIFRTTGGYYIYTNSDLTSGMYLSSGGSSWNAVSNRALKENFAPVDTLTLLERLAAIPITTWNYKAQDPAIRHIGPMADDFNALVDGLGGEGADYINSLDADGVALAAIQGLYQVVQEKDAQIASQQSEIANLQSQISTLEARLSALEQGRGAAANPMSFHLALPGAGLVLAAGLIWINQRKEQAR